MPRSNALTRGLTLTLLAALAAGGLPRAAHAQPAAAEPPAVNDQDQVARWEKAVADNPNDPRASFMLAYAVHASGDLDRAIELHKKAARFPQVRPMALYNLGCAYALRGDADAAFDALHKTVRLGNRDRAQFEGDADLKSLHTDARWNEMLDTIDTYNASPPEKALHFWAGQWDCYGATSGKLNGHNHLELRVNDNVIHEQWTDAGGSIGESWNYYNAHKGTWRQIWIDDKGIALEMDADVTTPREDGGVLFEGDQIRKDGSLVRIRMHVRPVGPGWVRQTGTALAPDGKSWTPSYDLVYVPKGETFDAKQLEEPATTSNN